MGAAADDDDTYISCTHHSKPSQKFHGQRREIGVEAMIYVVGHYQYNLQTMFLRWLRVDTSFQWERFLFFLTCIRQHISSSYNGVSWFKIACNQSQS